VVFAGCGVIGAGGGDFGVEQAERKTLSVIADASAPLFRILRPANTYVLRARIYPELSAVPDVLHVSRRTKIGLSIVQAIVVDVVAEQSFRNVNNEIVHIGIFAVLLFVHRYVTDGVKGGWAFAGIPFVSFQASVILGVNNGELLHRYRNFSESIAETKATKQKNEENNPPFEPRLNVDGNVDDPTSAQHLRFTIFVFGVFRRKAENDCPL